VHFEVYVDPGEVTLRLGSAVIFGLLLGIDREVRGYDAGMRTHMLVALGAAVMTLIAFELYDDLRKHQLDTAGDPLRVIEGVVTAVGFLGGGAIMRGNGEVQGLTTAANIWALRCSRACLRRRALSACGHHVRVYRHHRDRNVSGQALAHLAGSAAGEQINVQTGRGRQRPSSAG
jgi:hypothetical protein